VIFPIAPAEHETSFDIFVYYHAENKEEGIDQNQSALYAVVKGKGVI